MSKEYIIGDYKYSEWTVMLGSVGFVSGLVYGISTHKTGFALMLVSLVAALVGGTIGMIMQAPKPINE